MTIFRSHGFHYAGRLVPEESVGVASSGMRGNSNSIEPRAPFVGRTAELGAARTALRDTGEGTGRFIAITGDAGMGKTRLMMQIADDARAQGVRTLWSQLVEEPGLPPYFPWTQILKSCLQHSDDQALRADLGSGGADVAHIVPELGERLGLTSSSQPVNSAAARFQLFDSVSRFLLNHAARSPLVLLFDNLHSADRSTLALLEYFTRQIPNGPVLVMGAYRDAEIDEKHPLRSTLPALARGAEFMKLTLTGLSPEEVARLLEAQSGLRLSRELVEAIHQQSGGNPLFVSEVAGMLARNLANGAPPTSGIRFRIPDSLRDVINARLQSLGPEVTHALNVAAVLGREFDVVVLSRLAELRAGQLQARLQQAETAQVIERVHPGRYRFHHVLFREALYASHTSVRLSVLHAKAGEILEAHHQDNLRAHATELAHHFFEASRPDTMDKAIDYCRTAADLAINQRAHREAAALYERALQCEELATKQRPAVRFGLLLAMGKAQYQAGDVALATQTLMRSAILAHGQCWWARLAEALFSFQLVCQQAGYRHVASIPLHEAVLANLADDETALKARTLSSMAKAYRTAMEPDRARNAVRQAIEIARACGDPTVLLDCLRKANWTLGRHPDHLREGLAASYEALELAQANGPTEAVLDATTDILFQQADLGEVADIEARLPLAQRLAERERHPHFQTVFNGFRTSIAILRGEWETAEVLARKAVEAMQAHGAIGTRGRFAFQTFAMKKARGTLAEIAELATRIISASAGIPLWLPGQILLHVELDQPEPAREALAELGNLSELPADDLKVISLVYLTEACTRLGDLDRCRDLYQQLLPYRGLNATLPGNLMLGAVSGYLAMLAATLNERSEAGLLFEEAMVLNQAMGAEPFLAANQVGYAELLQGCRSEAVRARAGDLLMQAERTADRFHLEPIRRAAGKLRETGRLEHLTRREMDVLKEIATGASNQEISDNLHISHSTVTTHIRNIFRKTHVSNRTEAADYARRQGLLAGNQQT